MRRAGLLALAVVSVVLQLSLLPGLRPLGVVPDLALVVVVLAGLEGTASTALLMAVVAGLGLDLASGANFGLWTGLLVLAALTAGLIHRAGIELGGPTVAMVMVAVGTVLATVVILVGMAGVLPGWPVGLMAGRLVAELGLNLLLTLALRPMVARMVPPAAWSGEVR